MAKRPGGKGLLRIVSEGELQQRDADEKLKEAIEAEPIAIDNLAAEIRSKFETFKNHKTRRDIDKAYITALRNYKGEYSAAKLAEIRQFGGSEVFSKLTSVKCRGATALLRDVFLGGEKPWEVCPTPDPTTPDDISASIEQLVAVEMQAMEQRGIPVDPQQIEQRRTQLYAAAKRTTLKSAKEAAKRATTKLDDILTEGNFYKALAEFLIDLPIFPAAFIKGPIVRINEDVSWVGGKATVVKKPKLYWQRVSGMDLFYTPGVSNIADGEIIERIRLSRADLNALIGVPGYDEEVIREILMEYPDGYTETPIMYDQERTDLEEIEEPTSNESGLYDSLEYHGVIQGQKLLDRGFDEKMIADPVLDYAVTAWVIGNYIIKIQFNPNPRKRHPYYGTSFEQIPGSPVGNGIPEIIEDAQSVANATLRSLVNNMSISSGPQVGIIESRLSAGCDANSLYPWKRWRFVSDPMGTTEKPIHFFQPTSNASELLNVYKEMNIIADEVSAIPRYMSGSGQAGGAARTASGLSMLMSNASKVLQTVASSIDTEVMEPILQSLYDMVMLTDTTGLLRGDESIIVRGVQVAMQKEQDRMRRLEFLQITANPLDSQIVGPVGRASILRALATDLGLPEEDIVPSDDEIKATQSAQQAEAAAQAQGNQAPAPGSTGAGRTNEETDNAFRIGGGVI